MTMKTLLFFLHKVTKMIIIHDFIVWAKLCYNFRNWIHCHKSPFSMSLAYKLQVEFQHLLDERSVTSMFYVTRIPAHEFVFNCARASNIVRKTLQTNQSKNKLLIFRARHFFRLQNLICASKPGILHEWCMHLCVCVNGRQKN